MIVVDHIAVGPMLMNAAPGIAPVVEYLTAQIMPSDPPSVFVALRFHVIVAGLDVIKILNLERQVIERQFGALKK